MINFNGEVTENKEVEFLINNRGFAYGDALFETIRVINGKIMFWEDHYFRLMSSMRILRMEIPMEFSPEFLEKKILELLERNSLKHSPAKVNVYAFRNRGGLYKPKKRDISYALKCQPIENAFYILKDEDNEVELFKDYYLNSGLLSTLKTTNKLVNVLGSIYAEENDYQNCLLVNENKNVVEALNGNIFVVKGNTIKTPPIEDGCLNGITRKNLVKTLKEMEGFTIEEKSVSPFELQKADEIFITNVMVGILPITKYRKKTFENKIAKQLIGKLNTIARLG